MKVFLRELIIVIVGAGIGVAGMLYIHHNDTEIPDQSSPQVAELMRQVDEQRKEVEFLTKQTLEAERRSKVEKEKTDAALNEKDRAVARTESIEKELKTIAEKFESFSRSSENKKEMSAEFQEQIQRLEEKVQQSENSRARAEGYTGKGSQQSTPNTKPPAKNTVSIARTQIGGLAIESESVTSFDNNRGIEIVLKLANTSNGNLWVYAGTPSLHDIYRTFRNNGEQHLNAVATSDSQVRYSLNSVSGFALEKSSLLPGYPRKLPGFYYDLNQFVSLPPGSSTTVTFALACASAPSPTPKTITGAVSLNVVDEAVRSTTGDFTFRSLAVSQ